MTGLRGREVFWLLHDFYLCSDLETQISNMNPLHFFLESRFHWVPWVSDSRLVMSDSLQPMNYRLPGSSVHGILQARILEWVAIPFSMGSFWPRDWTWVSCIAGRFLTIWATGEAQFCLIETHEWGRYNGCWMCERMQDPSLSLHLRHLWGSLPGVSPSLIIWGHLVPWIHRAFAGANIFSVTCPAGHSQLVLGSPWLKLGQSARSFRMWDWRRVTSWSQSAQDFPSFRINSSMSWETPQSVQFSPSVVSDSLRLHGLQHARLPCPSPTSRAYANSCPSSRWCHPTISSSVIPFSSCLQSFPVSGSFPMS